ncbi:MAG: hypothetical protein ABIK45_11265 [Pseudomonadota bacterium]
MKRVISGLLAALLAISFAVPGLCNDDINVASGKFGIGYAVNGSANGYLRHGISGRYWVDDTYGMEGFVSFYNSDTNGGSRDKSSWDVSGKGMYSFVTKENSRFYGFGEIGYKEYTSNGETDGTLLVQPGVGWEYSFAEIPEVGFNIEVGYISTFFKDKKNSKNNNTNQGTSAAFGWHYYF